LILVLQWLIWLFLSDIDPDLIIVSVFSGLAGLLAIIIWWAFFSRAPIFERWSAVVAMIVLIVLTPLIVDESIATAMMGMMFPVYVTPIISLTFVVWALFADKLETRMRRITMFTSIVVACAIWIFLRTEGMEGDSSQAFTWRWSETHEEMLLAQMENDQMAPADGIMLEAGDNNWPGFRGKHRNAIVRDLQINTDWTKKPPEILWRRPIGPGISSFAVHGDLFYTQEQRGEEEIVACYRLNDGRPVWRHADTARFWDSHAGAGPRGTPTLKDDRVYTLGPTGILNVLDARDGTVMWSRKTTSDTEVNIPEWGIASSPLVVDSAVIVALVGKLAAYDIQSGDPLWFGPDGGDGYSSPHLVTIDSIEQVIFMSGKGVISVNAINGSLYWEHEWPPGTRIVQPGITPDGDLLIGGGQLNGIRRIAVTHQAGEWMVEERWTSKKFKPYFNDFVIHKGHAFGFNGPRLASINVENGERNWAGGRFGYGQLLLLADQDLLIVQSEKGELALVQATKDRFNQLVRIPALEGKTWNHPVLVGDILLVRNSEEMAAFRLVTANQVL
jgi:hypothetical protein